MNKLVIFGAGGHAKVVCDACMASGKKVDAFLVDWKSSADKMESTLMGLPVILLEDWIAIGSGITQFIVAIGNNKVRAEKHQLLISHGYHAVSIMHPSSILSPSARIGEGSYIGPGSIINADAVIGCGAILNTACIIEHDCNLGDFVHISPGAKMAGGVEVGSFTQVGIGSTIRENVQIGEHALIGAGSVVVSSLPSNYVSYGIPAQPKRLNQ